LRAEKAPPTDMKCPKCGRFSLQVLGSGVRCKICGYDLTPGQVDKYRLFQMLKSEDKKRH
jgi:ribosomal protein L37E